MAIKRQNFKFEYYKSNENVEREWLWTK